jgi:small subunit ribosomal protein S6
MVHPDQSDKIPLMIEKYKKIIHDNSGKIHRLEDWGRRQLSYSIKKLHKAHYILMNIEVFPQTISLLETEFRFNNFILRNIIMSMKKAVIESSPILKLKDDKKEKK